MIIHSSPLPDVEIPNITITTHVLHLADELPDRIAIRDAAGTSSYTFAELSSAIHSLAGGLKARSVAPGTVVGLMAPNVPEYAVVFHGVAVAGAAVTTARRGGQLTLENHLGGEQHPACQNTRRRGAMLAPFVRRHGHHQRKSATVVLYGEPNHPRVTKSRGEHAVV